MSKKYKSSILFGLFIALVGLGLVYKTQDNSSSFVSKTQKSTSTTSAIVETTNNNQSILGEVQPPIQQQADVAGKLPQLERIKSLNGTNIRGDLRIDENGNLIIEKSVKHLFDYFLNVAGEVPRDDLIAQIQKGITDYLAEPAQSQALALFANYLSYKAALQSEIDNGLYNVSTANLEDLETTFQTRSQLRSFHLGNEAASAFFKEEEARDQFTMGKLRLNANTNLSEAEREAELVILESSLPESHQKVMQKHRTRQTISTKIDTLRKENADIYTLQEEWSKHYDSETVERFVSLENNRKAWNNRYNDYLQQKASLASNSSSESAYMQALEQLKQTMFNDAEILRVNAKERIAQY